MTATARLPQTPATSDRYRILCTTLIDGTGAAPVQDAEVVVNGQRIERVGPRRHDAALEGYRTVDLTGYTVLPGFIDTHVHFGVSIDTPPMQAQARFASEQAVITADVIRRTLAAGITTARDLGGIDAGFRNAIERGYLAGPRLHLALEMLSPTGGHGDFHFANGAPSGLGHRSGLSPIIDTDDDVRRVVRHLMRSGADVIKVCTTGGVTSPTDTPHDLGVPADHVRLIREETAKRQSQPVAAHAQGNAGIREAILGGAASIEHGYELDDATIELMLERDVTLVPTLSTALRLPDPASTPAYLYEKKVKWSEIARQNIGKAITAGVRIALGTDAGISPHARNLTELVHLVDLGATPMQAIQAGTVNAARLLRLDAHLGTIAEGKLADLVASPAKPLDDIGALAAPGAITAVVQGGIVRVDRDAKWGSAQALAAGGIREV